MAITSSSTYADVAAQFADNVEGWRSDLVKARAFQAAVTWLLVNRPDSTVGQTKLSFQALKDLLEKVDDFVAANDPTVAAVQTTNRASFTKARFK